MSWQFRPRLAFSMYFWLPYLWFMFHTKKISLKKKENFIDICQNCWKSNSQLVKKHYCINHWVAFTNIQQKMYFLYLFFNCWNIDNLNLKLHNLVFLNKYIFNKGVWNINPRYSLLVSNLKTKLLIVVIKV